MFKIQIENFEGPLDLLLQLIEGEKLDITQISLASITDDYIRHISDLDARSLEVAEFLVIASKLIYIKSRAIIPTFQTEEEEEEIEDLEKKLREYQRYKEAAKLLHDTLETGYRSFQRKNGPKFQIQTFTPPEGIDPNILLEILTEVFDRVPEEEVKEKEEVYERKISVEDKVFEFQTLFKSKKKLSFREILKKATTRHEVIVSFLAILDLMKKQEISVSQDDNFSDIMINVVQN